MLADISTFIAYLHQVYQDGNYNDVVLFGSGYGGTMAVWARKKLPHLVKGAWSSSGVFQINLASLSKFSNAFQMAYIGILNMLVVRRDRQLVVCVCRRKRNRMPKWCARSFPSTGRTCGQRKQSAHTRSTEPVQFTGHNWHKRYWNTIWTTYYHIDTLLTKYSVSRFASKGGPNWIYWILLFSLFLAWMAWPPSVNQCLIQKRLTDNWKHSADGWIWLKESNVVTSATRV